MSAKPWPEGTGCRILQEVDSTNAEARRLAPTLSGPEWILAHRQTTGRGRRGRPWANPVGNFTATLVMQPGETPDKVALRSFVASLALFDAFVAATGRVALFALKWPNDVLLNGGKVAGILLESAGAGGTLSHFCIGIGVNLVAAPSRSDVDESAITPVDLQSETGARVTPEEFLDLLAPAFADWEAQFSTYGFAPIRQAWLNRAAKIGEVITARTGKESVVGTFETIDDTGALVLKTASGRRVISAAEVFF
ncbi:biotin--[acetyl-CoA-carboxylase] ligase [Pseudohalocynthiibacter sp. F2068]|uniref:biotin--[acetyl-CoA-carboxylase] ligase n=1 Tax=Pseudohalocynthiibacter sp. F2068 TaxID=2926418 RepID=UPI001FF3B0C5|nr:biotin--[acetyl-CoA-carboxylase] ligase [Pseudohalocynthiibacter sp. F2068]MCK0101772.1 biotin--[acetyl-CoA-carboxylase] ligase [Pseudohalocynthiibacter sp. F2068]